MHPLMSVPLHRRASGRLPTAGPTGPRRRAGRAPAALPVLFALVAAVVLGGCASTPSTELGPAFQAVMRPADGQAPLGTLHFASREDHLQVSGSVRVAGEHHPLALVVLDAADCSGVRPSGAARLFEPAGRTVNPRRVHDEPAALIGWLQPDGTGHDAVELRSRRLGLADGSMFDIRGRSVGLYRPQQLAAGRFRHSLPPPLACGVIALAG